MPDEPLQDFGIHELAIRVADGTATPDQAQMLLIEFVRWHDHGATPPPRLIEHVARSFAAYLNGKRPLSPAHNAKRAKSVAVSTLDQAFGLVRKRRGQPRIDRDTEHDVAMFVLGRLIEGRSLESVATERVNDFETPGCIYLVSKDRVCWRRSPVWVG